jgi:hypothetical protein
VDSLRCGIPPEDQVAGLLRGVISDWSGEDLLAADLEGHAEAALWAAVMQRSEIGWKLE